MMWFGDGFDGGWMNAGMSMMAVFWLGLLALIWLIVARLTGRREHGSDRPEDILKTRLARGEIELADYERPREQLRA